MDPSDMVTVYDDSLQRTLDLKRNILRHFLTLCNAKNIEYAVNKMWLLCENSRVGQDESLSSVTLRALLTAQHSFVLTPKLWE